MNIEAKLNSITTDMFIEKSDGLKDILVRLFASFSLDIKSSQTKLKINSAHKSLTHLSCQLADAKVCNVLIFETVVFTFNNFCESRTTNAAC